MVITGEKQEAGGMTAALEMMEEINSQTGDLDVC